MIRIRCSSLGALMTKPKNKKVLTYFKEGIEISARMFDKLLLAGNLDGITCTSETIEVHEDELSETAKTEVRKIWIANEFGKSKDFSNKYTDKGNFCEPAGIDMLAEKLGVKLVMKNDETFRNKFITGTPDIVEQDFVADVKCPYDLENYMKQGADDYIEQLQGYLALTGKPLAYLAYCLLDAPEWLILQEINRLIRKTDPNDIEAHKRIEEETRFNMTFDNVPKEQRVKVYEILPDPEFMERVYAKVEKAREYYKTLSLIPKLETA